MEIRILENREQADLILSFFYGPGVWYWKLSADEKKTIKRRVETALKEKMAKYWFFTDKKGEVIAAGGTNLIEDTYGGFFVSWFGVHSTWRRKGLGSRIIEEAEKYALKNKARFMTIDTGEGNKEANIFYQAIGYRRVGFVPDYYGPGDGKVIYHKKLLDKQEGVRK